MFSLTSPPFPCTLLLSLLHPKDPTPALDPEATALESETPSAPSTPTAGHSPVYPDPEATAVESETPSAPSTPTAGHLYFYPSLGMIWTRLVRLCKWCYGVVLRDPFVGFIEGKHREVHTRDPCVEFIEGKHREAHTGPPKVQ